MSIGPWDFNGFDIAVLVICLISFLMAMSKGLGKELISMLALVVGIIATLFVWGQYRPLAYNYVQPDWLADGVLGVGTFFLSYMLVKFLLKNITGQRGVPSFANRLLGGGFGAGRGLVVASLLTMVVNSGHYDDLKAGVPEADLAPFLEESTLYKVALVPIGTFIKSLPLPKIKEAGKKLADGDVDGAIQDGKDIIEEGKEIIDENE